MWTLDEPKLLQLAKDLSEGGMQYPNCASVYGLCIWSWPWFEQNGVDQMISKRSVPSYIVSSFSGSVGFNSTKLTYVPLLSGFQFKYHTEECGAYFQDNKYL